MVPCEQAPGNSGGGKVLFNRKKPVAEPSSGRREKRIDKIERMKRGDRQREEKEEFPQSLSLHSHRPTRINNNMGQWILIYTTLFTTIA